MTLNYLWSKLLNHVPKFVMSENGVLCTKSISGLDGMNIFLFVPKLDKGGFLDCESTELKIFVWHEDVSPIDVPGENQQKLNKLSNVDHEL